MRRCYACGTRIDGSLKVFRSSLCPGCGKELKVCLNCRFYSPGSHWDCRETIDEPVTNKEKANFCAYFEYKQDNTEQQAKKPGQDAKNAFLNLFKDND